MVCSCAVPSSIGRRTSARSSALDFDRRRARSNRRGGEWFSLVSALILTLDASGWMSRSVSSMQLGRGASLASVRATAMSSCRFWASSTLLPFAILEGGSGCTLLGALRGPASARRVIAWWSRMECGRRCCGGPTSSRMRHIRACRLRPAMLSLRQPLRPRRSSTLMPPVSRRAAALELGRW